MNAAEDPVKSYWEMVRDPDCVVRVWRLTHAYGGVKALDEVGLTVRRGEVFGLIGSNGAGKTTLLRILATLLVPTRGQVYVMRHSLRRHPHHARMNIGYMPDSIQVREELTVDEYLGFYAAIYRLDPRTARQTIREAIETVGLQGRGRSSARSLSLGMQQRLSLARLLLHDPNVLLLDEPAAGLDPAGRIEMKDLLGRMRALGKTVILSSHILSDVAQTCTRVGILEKGKLLFSGTVEGLLAAAGTTSRLEIRLKQGQAEGARRCLRDALPGIDLTEGDGALRVRLGPDPLEAGQIFGLLVCSGFLPQVFRREQTDLEAAFLRMTKGEVA